MIDQYGDPVPERLCIMPQVWEIESIFPEDAARIIAEIDKLDWYEFPRFPMMLWVDRRKLDAIHQKLAPVLGLFSSSEMRIDFQNEIQKIDHVLHRYSHEDGFYHA